MFRAELVRVQSGLASLELVSLCLQVQS